MKYRVISLVLLLGSGVAFAQFPSQITRVVVIFQENRTPDNLFHFLTPACPIPRGASGLAACIPAPVTTSCYDISPCGLSNRGPDGTIVPPFPVTLKPTLLSGSVDPDHSHKGFVEMCNPDPKTFECRNDGAWLTSKPAGDSYAYVSNPGVTNSDGSRGTLLEPYLILARQYGWANYMYQTNQGPSYPAHQFIFAGTSAPTVADDKNSTFVSENFNGKVVGSQAGCLALAGGTSGLISPALPPNPKCTQFPGSVQECEITNTALKYPTNPVGTFCYHHQSMADVLYPHSITWKYYAPSPGSIWTAPDSIKAICEPAWVNPVRDPGSAIECTGTEWNDHVDTKNLGTDILRDIRKCDLAMVNWVIPDGRWSDHAGPDDQYGPSWVAAVVNAIGNNKKCATGTRDAGQTYWENTAIVITWDDWGGWSDNQPAQFQSKLPCTSTDCQADYQLGFRVPLIVVSAYTPTGTINNDPHDFGSILRMIEGINHITEGQLGFADERARSDLHRFFTLRVPRAYHTIPAVMNANFFLSQKGPSIDPDDE
ncbi:MAG TPA: alkaline phosphatase family protein [Silvibacterium sp.]|nr:alkaline phosphatase family protein [Silvibacterium sp.]